MSASAAKILGGLLCVIFLATLKPLLCRAAAFVQPSMRQQFLQEIRELGAASPVPKSAIWALIAGTAVCLAVGAALTPDLGEASIVIGGACGASVLYPYFFCVLYQRARRAVPNLPNERRS
jgi:hypothetical protein